MVEHRTTSEEMARTPTNRVDNLAEICSDQKVELQQLKDSTRVSVANTKKELDNVDKIDPATQSQSSKRNEFWIN